MEKESGKQNKCELLSSDTNILSNNSLNYNQNILLNENNIKINEKFYVENENQNRNKEDEDDSEETTSQDNDNEIDAILRNMPLTEDITCGFWIFKGKFLQRFANKKAYVMLYGLVGCIFGMTYAYFNGIITTIEKRFKIPSRNTGIISVGNDISTLFISAILSYYAAKKHRPRWIGIGLCTIVAFCLLSSLPHFIYGPGEDALSLTLEYDRNLTNYNATNEIINNSRKKTLCKVNGSIGQECENEQEGSNLVPQLILFIGQLISGIGGSLYYTLGVAYMDDNVKRSKTPALISLSFFLRMLGPAMGYALASFCLKLYISPSLTPNINENDPRWLGAYWLGWLILAGLLFIFGILISLFPRQLPRTAARKILKQEKLEKLSNKNNKEYCDDDEENDLPASFQDMKDTFKRLITNKAFMFNNFASIFYIFGYIPYWIFTPKYIEIQYRQSAALSSLVTGTVALAFSALGILLAGYVISKYKPSARAMGVWNIFIGISSVMGIFSYTFLGCSGYEDTMIINIPKNSTSVTCNSNCLCDYVKYSPVCGEDGNTYISPCHAGCKEEIISHSLLSEKKIYNKCSCIESSFDLPTEKFIEEEYIQIFNEFKDFKLNETISSDNNLISNITYGGKAISGACPVDCLKPFMIFLGIMCFLKFIGATGRATNFLLTIRCVIGKDKTASMGFGLMMMCCFAFIPSPIFYGWILDKFCLVWGKTCTNKGNCWLYDAEMLRKNLNFLASLFMAIGVIFDVGVWYYVKNIKIFDEEVNKKAITKKIITTTSSDIKGLQEKLNNKEKETKLLLENTTEI